MARRECERRHTLAVVRQAHGTEALQMHVRSGPLLAATHLATEEATSCALRLFVVLHMYLGGESQPPYQLGLTRQKKVYTFMCALMDGQGGVVVL